MKEQKTGILTFHRCINYGSYWQSRCLVEALQSRGMDAVILDHESRQVNLAEWRCAYQPVLPTPVPASDFPLYRRKIERFFEAFDQLPLSPRFPLQHPEQMGDYNTVVVGSDEVWNLFHPWYGKCPLFFGEGITADRVISYAASFGNYPIEWGLDDEWTAKLYNFDSISVRDENAQAMIQNAMNIEPALVLDPCLQFPIELEKANDQRFEGPYLALYGHNFSKHFVNEIRRWAKHRNLPVISIGYRNDWADVQWLDAGPLDFPQFIQNAEAVATNFFHGCVFSLRFAKPFVCETTVYRSQKITGLLTMLDARKHMVFEDTPATVIAECLTGPLVQQVFDRITHYRHLSNEFLMRALDAPQVRVA
ncbi:MAG: polysaccharide pyruvyl transferase family protein [Bacteroidota bacterium]|nr:polysaccharide pyruvyl transferase family protein [Bacteroidota bacterium]